MRFNDRYKTMLFNERLIHMSIRDDYEEKLMNREQIQIATRIDNDSPRAAE